MISYAQNFEDVLLERVFKKISNGFYVDIGAADPVIDSLTKHFYEKGWRGINIEPSSFLFDKLSKERVRDINLNIVVSDYNGTIDFFDLPNSGLSTIVENNAIAVQNNDKQRDYAGEKVEGIRKIILQSKRLESILNEYAEDIVIDFLKVDVEGAEKAVLLSNDWNKFRPKVLVIEATVPNSQVLTYKEWDKILIDADYTFVFFDGLNRFYLRNDLPEFKELFSYSPCVFDDFIKYSDFLQQQKNHELLLQNSNLQVHYDKLLTYNTELQSQHNQILTQYNEMQIQHNELKAQNQELQLRIDSIINSHSWRITAPMRFCMQISRKILNLQKRILISLIKFPQKIGRRLIIIFSHFVLRISFVAYPIKSLLRKFPSLYKKLQMLAKTEDGNLSVSTFYKMFTDRKSSDRRILFYYVDHTVKSPTNSGLERVARMLSRALLDMGEQVHFVKWSSERKTLVYINQADLLHLEKWNGPVPGRHERKRYPGDQDSDKCIKDFLTGNHWLIIPEVTYITQHPSLKTSDIILEASAKGFKVACVFYDLIPLHRPELSLDVPKHSEYVKQLLGADVVLPISEWSRQDLIRFLNEFKLPGNDLESWAETIALPAESMLRARNQDYQLAIEHKNIILCVGSITPHKNQLALMRAFNEYCKKNIDTKWRLVLVGNLHPLAQDEFTQLMKENFRIQWDGHSPDEVLKNWYTDCAFTVFPSIMEGYGLPIVESLWFGKPCICADFGAMAEPGALPGCVMINTSDEHTLEAAISKLIENPDRLKALVHDAVTGTLTTWQDYAQSFVTKLDIHDVDRTRPCIWVDVTELASHDAGTGIQRVTRSLAKRFLLSPPPGYNVKLVRIARDKTTYTTADTLTAKLLGNPETADRNLPISCKANDIFLGLDLVPQLITLSEWFRKQKVNGIIIIFFLYDLILFRNPEFFHDGGTDTWFPRFLHMIKEFSDTIICISESTARDYENWIGEHYPVETYRPDISWFHLGADFEKVDRFGEITDKENSIIESLTGKNNFLMVGTLEPRKGYTQTLDAFEILWNDQTDVNMIIVGKVGWKISDFVERIKNHRENGKRLFWFKEIQDAFLEKIYSISTVLIAASYNEGYGLPIIEASRHKLHVLARDIPVFREVAGEHASYFNAKNASELADRIIKWIFDYQRALLPPAGNIPWVTWDHCCENAKRILINSVKKNSLSEIDTFVSIIIPVYNNVNLTRQCIESIYAQPTIIPFEVIIVDDASTDSTALYLSNISDKVRFIRNSSNLRFAYSCNSGSRIAQGNYLLFLNNDTIVEPGWMEALVSRANSDSQIGIVGARLLYPNRTIQHCGLEFINNVVKLGMSPIHRLRNEPHDHSHASYPMKVAAVTGACLLIKKELFDKIGGFDESYRMYYEDIDLCFKVTKLGYDIVYEPAATVIHLERQSFDLTVDLLQIKAIDIFNSKWALAVINLGPLAKGIPYINRLNNVSGIQKQPKLSICITTYNRAEWLKLNLKNIDMLLSQPREDIEIIICDNASTDSTPEIVNPYLDKKNFKYIRNAINVGMLGNLRETARAASGDYIWLIGDDDFIIPGAIETILNNIRQYPSLSLIYLNFSYTNETDPSAVKDLPGFISSATPIGPLTPDYFGTVAEISSCSENFFTAIYCIVFRRDHALRVYLQNTDGPPFSSMITCIPTTYYVLNKMMRENGLWIGKPQVVGNLNNSWSKYAPLWILERIPEVHDTAEMRGANPERINHWRRLHLHHMKHWFKDIYFNDPLNNVVYFDIEQMLKRIENLEESSQYLPYFKEIYTMAYNSKKPGAKIDPEILFGSYNILLK